MVFLQKLKKLIMEINFFKQKTARSASERKKLLQNDIINPSKDYFKFGYDYFDNPKSPIGYQGYYYDGRYRETVKKIIDYYKLRKNSKILEIGCSKGYVLIEFQKAGMEVFGIDISSYAVNNAHPNLKGKIKQKKAYQLNYPDNYFDLVLTKETLPHVEKNKIEKTIKEIDRVTKKKSFHVIQCGRNKKELQLMIKWDPTHKILKTPQEWKDLFLKISNNFDYQFKILFPLKKDGIF